VQPVDFVVLYLDGTDPEWREQKRRFSEAQSWPGQNTDDRYRNMDNFQYWFRAVERYAPWVHRIHLVTWGHVPSWLNTDHPKLNIVRHDQFMDPAVLPVFNSNAIELSLDRLEALGEYFVAFNDDVFLNNPVGPEQFFVGGRPRIDCVCGPALASTDFNAVLFNNMRIVNQVAKPSLRFYLNAISPRNGIRESIYSASLLPTTIMTGKFVGFRELHAPHPIRKSVLRWLKSQVPEPYERTIKAKFREYRDVSIWSVNDYMRASGHIAVAPMAAENAMVFFRPGSDYEKALNSRYKTVCLEDSAETVDFDTQVTLANAALARKFPEKSQFEK